MTKYPNYAAKKEAQKGGSYDGDSPFFKNIPEFQWLKPIESYSHLQQYLSKRKSRKEEYEEEQQHWWKKAS